uniref:Saposin A-type domain-containing protein n=1 Tax=Amblyomma maculatum TaxID=34609 RepID=G3MMK6_AMBMU
MANFLRECLLVLTLVFAAEASQVNVINITLYYEGLCGGCHGFILDELHPTYGKLEQYLKLDLLPFGNAQMKVVNGTVVFSCQHGPDECYVNEVQTCAVKYVHPTRKLLDFIACMLSHDDPTKAGEPCAQKVGTDWGVLNRCSTGPEGTQLLYEMGKRTREHRPSIEYVPWIEVNGVHNHTIQEQAQGNLFGFACELLEPDQPRICKKSSPYCFSGQ